MIEVFTGFAVIALAVIVGWVAGRTGVLGPEARPVLARLNFNVLAPFLLFSVLARADVGALFSVLLPVSAIAAIAVMAVFALVSLLIWRHGLARTTVGSLGAGYVNANNFGIPIAVYMLGDAAYSAPIVLLQLLLFAPIALAILGAKVTGATSAWQIVRATITNPIIVGSLLGVLVAVTGLELPPIVIEPIALIGSAAVPLMLIAYGLSLHGQRLLEAGTGRREVLLASSPEAHRHAARRVGDRTLRVRPRRCRVVRRHGARRAAHRAERVQLRATVRDRRDRRARHRLHHDGRFGARAAHGRVPARLKKGDQMPFLTDNRRPLDELALAQRQADGYRFELRAPFVYVDPVSGRRYPVPAQPEQRVETDLASVPTLVWAFITSSAGSLRRP